MLRLVQGDPKTDRALSRKAFEQKLVFAIRRSFRHAYCSSYRNNVRGSKLSDCWVNLSASDFVAPSMSGWGILKQRAVPRLFQTVLKTQAEVAVGKGGLFKSFQVNVFFFLAFSSGLLVLFPSYESIVNYGISSS